LIVSSIKISVLWLVLTGLLISITALFAGAQDPQPLTSAPAALGFSGGIDTAHSSPISGIDKL
jgi:hypothetical protein